MSLADSPGQNHLLAALPRKEFANISGFLELVPMPLGKMLYVPDEELSHAYFPTTSIVSLHYITESGATAEMAGVGNEGMVGVSLYMGGNSTPSSAVVQTAGAAFRWNAAGFSRNSTVPVPCRGCCFATCRRS